jgi:NADH-quinone oxidoreductase subunit J
LTSAIKRLRGTLFVEVSMFVGPVLLCCALAIVSAACVVLLQRPVHVALGLLGHSLSMAALYLTMNAQMSAVAQTLIYSGAVVVLFLIVVALLPEGGAERLSAGRLAGAGLAFVVVLGLLIAALLTTWQVGGEITAVVGEAADVKAIGKPLFSSLIVPFELTAPLLLTAIVSAIALWRRQETRGAA